MNNRLLSILLCLVLCVSMFPASAMAGAEDCESGIHQLEFVPESRICGNAYRAHYRCSDCGQLFEDEDGTIPTTAEDLSIAEMNHNDVALVYQQGIAPTCKAAGSREYWYCPTCNQKFLENSRSKPVTDESLVLTALPHTINPESWQAPVAHTCSIDGSVGYYTCSVCEQHFADMEGKTLLTSIVDPARHQLTEHAEKEVSCTEDGNAKYYSCENCDLFFDADKKAIDEDSWVISHEGHQYVGHAANEPTLESEGNRFYYSCSNCDKLFDAEYNETTWDQIVIAKLVAPEAKRGVILATNEKKVVDSGMCGAQGSNLTWTYYDNGELVIEGSGEMTNYSSGGQPWSEYRRQIVSISIPDGITSIGNYAFSQCNISSILIPNGTTKIGDSAFFGITNIVEVEIPDSVTTIGQGAFSYCTSLTNIILSDSLAAISDLMFSNCTNIETINLPSSIKGIGSFAFSDCRKLSSIELPEGAVFIGNNAFSGCTNLQSVSLPTSIKWIRDKAFIGCSRLTDVYYSGTAEARDVLKNVIHNWSSVENNLLYAANWRYGGNHFVLVSGECGTNGNNAVWTLYDNGSMTISGEGAIRDFGRSGAAWSVDGTVYKDVIKSVIIEEGITKIGDYAFKTCENLSSITIPDGLTSFGEDPFAGCTHLTTAGPASGDYGIKIGYKTSIPHMMFSCFPYLTSAVIPNGIVTIDFAFKDCDQLTSVVIPNSVTSIGRYAFSDCSSLVSITIPASVTEIDDFAFKNCSSLTSIAIPEGVTSIGQYAFSGCADLSSINIPENLSSISYGVFYDCSSLTSIMIPSSVTSIGNGAFHGCTSLASITIPGLVTMIHDNAFSDCNTLAEIHFLGAPSSISDSAFTNVTADAYYPAGNPDWTPSRMKNYGGHLTWKTSAADTYEVTFVSNHGTAVPKQTVPAGGVATEPQDPTDPNFVFDDWYSDEACTRPFNFTSAINANTNIYAKWKCLVTFHTDYGRAPKARIVDINGTTTKPDDLSYTGLTFGGWTNAAGTNFNFNTPIRTNTSIYAKWLCQVTFVTAHGDAPSSRNVNIEGTVSNPGSLSWIGYQWGGWTNAEGRVFDFRTPITSNTSLYAKWLPDLKITKGSGGTAHHGSTYAFTLNYYYPDYLENSSIFTVYVGKHDSGAVAKLKYNDNYLVTQGADKRVVVTLKAPYIQGLTEGETYDIIFATGLPDPPADLGKTEGTFKVSKAPKTIFTVTFDRGVATDAENMPKDQTIEAGTNASKPTTDPIATGYRFDKWCKDAALTKEFDFSKELISTDTTIYAKWIKTHTVKFVTKHGVAPTDLVVDENSKAKKPTDPKMEGYKFDGWFTDKECKKAFDWNSALTEDISLYAKWTGKLEITKGNGGTAHYGSSYEFTLNCSLAQVYDTFTVYVNSKWLDPEKYELSEGSTVVTLKKEYIRSLAAGTYNIEFDTGIDDLGSVKGTFKVSTSPKTGDESDIGLWIAVGCLSAVAAAAIVVYLIRKKK